MSWALPYSTGDEKTCNFIHWNCRYIFDCDTITVDCIFSGSVSNRYRLYQVEKVSIVFEELIDLFFCALLVAFLAARFVGFLFAWLVALLFAGAARLVGFLVALLFGCATWLVGFLVAFLFTGCAAWLVGFLFALLFALLFRSTFCLGTFLLARLGVLSRN